MKKAESTLKTKKKIAKALKNKLKNTEFEKISISDLIKDCEITRSTFYYHFEDIYDLLKWIFEGDILEILKNRFNTRTWKESILEIFDYLYNNKEMCDIIFNSPNKVYIQKFLFLEIRPIIINFIKEEVGNNNVKEQVLNFIVDFYVGAIINTIERWFAAAMQEKPKEVVDLIGIAVEGNIVNALQKL